MSARLGIVVIGRNEGARLERVRASFEQQRAALKEYAESLGEIGLGELDEDTLKQLRELGYVE